MTWSYGGNPSTSDPKDAVRFEIQDTDESAPLLQDGEIEAMLAEEAGEEPDLVGILRASARCCEALARRFTWQADSSAGELKLTYTKQAEGARKMAGELRERAAALGGVFAGGLTRSEKIARRMDPNRIQPLFRRGQFRNPWRRFDGGAGLGP